MLQNIIFFGHERICHQQTQLNFLIQHRVKSLRIFVYDKKLIPHTFVMSINSRIYITQEFLLLFFDVLFLLLLKMPQLNCSSSDSCLMADYFHLYVMTNVFLKKNKNSFNFMCLLINSFKQHFSFFLLD